MTRTAAQAVAPTPAAMAQLPPDQRRTAAWAAALLLALAREEAAGRRSPPALLEPGRPTWTRFRGRLNNRDLLALLFEDAAFLHPIPFTPPTPDALARIPVDLIDDWLAALPTTQPEPADYLAAQARLLGVPSRLARSDLHVVKPHHRVLELPGTGGQLAHHLLLAQPELRLQSNFTILGGSPAELTLAGIVALDRAAPDSSAIVSATAADLRDPDHPIRVQGRSSAFDFVIGLHPDKGGLLRRADQLDIYFHGATILLV